MFQAGTPALWREKCNCIQFPSVNTNFDSMFYKYCLKRAVTVQESDMLDVANLTSSKLSTLSTIITLLSCLVLGPCLEHYQKRRPEHNRRRRYTIAWGSAKGQPCANDTALDLLGILQRRVGNGDILYTLRDMLRSHFHILDIIRLDCPCWAILLQRCQQGGLYVISCKGQELSLHSSNNMFPFLATAKHIPSSTSVRSARLTLAGVI